MTPKKLCSTVPQFVTTFRLAGNSCIISIFRKGIDPIADMRSILAMLNVYASDHFNRTDILSLSRMSTKSVHFVTCPIWEHAGDSSWARNSAAILETKRITHTGRPVFLA